MPKLRDPQIEKNQEKIERAALRLFIQRGFHGTSVRDIAREAGVSLGNVYNYYRGKENLFQSLVRRYEKKMAALMRAELAVVTGSIDDPENLRKLAAGVRRIVYKEPDYWRLMYMDITEFGNKHFAFVFRDLSKRLRRLLSQPISVENGHNSRVRPDVAFTAIYLQFFSYFLVEKLFRGKNHLGVPEGEAIEQLIEIFSHGVHAGSGQGVSRTRSIGAGTVEAPRAQGARAGR
ncbi:MAG: TetR/AcrR family transcriptional regulator [Terriglobales bacterium]